MATQEQISELRRKVSEPDESTYTDSQLSAMIDENGDSVDATAAVIWRDKAAIYAELVDISEAGSSRKNSQLMRNALDMASYYAANSDTELVAGVDYPTTTRIVRA